ncbi:MAG: VWA domain-containing protein [Pyrobaculum sp.]
MDKVLDIITAIQNCLGEISIRSLAYALADVYARSYLGEIDDEKIFEILAQNLAGLLRLSPLEAKKVLKDAIECKDKSSRVVDNVIGSVGSEKAPTLAHIVNKHVPIDASPRAKLEVIKKLNLPADELIKGFAGIYAKSEGVAYLKSAIKTIRQRYLNTSPFDIDLMKTAISINRKKIKQEFITDLDIYIREYIHIIDKPVYIALDVSGSMKEYSGNMTKLYIAKRAIAKYLQQMASLGGSVSLVLFNTEADFMWVPHQAKRYLYEMLEILRYIYAMGGTELASALELLYNHGVKNDVVIITDGRTKDVEKVLSLAKKFRRLHVVATERSSLLKQLAKLAGGKYRELTPMLDIFSLHS